MDACDLEFWEKLEARLTAANILGKRRGWTFGSHPGTPSHVQCVKNWVRNPENVPRGLLLFGSAGTGKTGLGVAALREMVAKGEGSAYYWLLTAGEKTLADVKAGDMRWRPAPVTYESWSSMIRRFQHAATGREDDVNEYEMIREYNERCSCLMLDDIDVGQMTPFREAILLVFLAWVEESDRRLILTMNRTPDEAASVLGERVVDRITGSEFLKVKMAGASLRGR